MDMFESGLFVGATREMCWIKP